MTREAPFFFFLSSLPISVKSNATCLSPSLLSCCAQHAASGLFSWSMEHFAFASRQFASKIMDLSVRFIFTFFANILPCARAKRLLLCSEGDEDIRCDDRKHAPRKFRGCGLEQHSIIAAPIYDSIITTPVHDTPGNRYLVSINSCILAVSYTHLTLPTNREV